MARPIKPLTRRQLYDLVWSHPATDLARKLRISSVAVGKACRRWNIPAPPRGYWAKLRHEKTVPTPPPLPDGAEPAEPVSEFWKLLRSAGVDDLLMFSSNYPRWDHDTPDVASCPDEKRGAIWSGTALGTYPRWA